MTIPAGTLVPRDARDFGNYELIAKIATGGMAEIYLARTRDPAGKRERVVVKRILPHLAEDEHFVTMFRDEANLASKLVHNNVCRVFALGYHDATWFIAMEYLHGVALSRMLSRLAKRNQLVDYRMVAGMIIQACDGLHHAHEARDSGGTLLNVVHRDVSPPNIMLNADGAVKLLDFGIAKARGANSRTRTGTVKGKNAYMSPEQILGKPLDRRSDVFALGAVMYELLAVKRLFHRDSDFLTFKAITEEAIPDMRERRPDIPAPLRAALTQALARDPTGRFATARGFAEAVRQGVAGLGGPATPEELSRYVTAEFGDELTARDELLRAADDPSIAPGTATRTPPMAIARTQTIPSEIIELEAIGGELDATVTDRKSFDLPDDGPSMIVAGGDPAAASSHAPRTRAKTATPPPLTPAQLAVLPMPPGASAGRAATPLATPVFVPPFPSGPVTAPITVPMPIPVPGFSMGPGASGALPASAASSFGFPMPPGMDAMMPESPPTDILKAYRRRNLRNIVIALGLLVAVATGAIVLSSSRSSSDEPASKIVVTPIVDAAPAQVAVAPPDADTTRTSIEALSKYGFLSMDASAPTVIFVDNQRIGETPITRWPLKPGIRKVRAVGPRSKVKRFDVTILGAQDTDAGMIAW